MATSEDADGLGSFGPAKPPIVFRRYDDGFIVRSMTAADAHIVQRWYGGMGHVSKYDLDVTLSVYPPGEGFYIGELDGVVIASAIRIPWAATILYGSLYFVHADYRRKGYGTRLRDEVARDHVRDRVLCVDAVLGKVAETNRKHGYRDAFTTARFLGIARATYGVTLDEGDQLLPATSVSFDEIISYDNKCFIEPDSPVRRRFLQKWLAIEGGVSYVITDVRGHVIGFGCRRPCMESGYHMVGPLYADNAVLAKAILQEMCADIVGDEYCLHMWCPNSEALELADDFAMDHAFDTLRMHLNGNPNELKREVYALTSIDVCGF